MTDAGTRETAQAGTCPHGRSSWRSCPHCLGVNGATQAACCDCGEPFDAKDGLCHTMGCGFQWQRATVAAQAAPSEPGEGERSQRTRDGEDARRLAVAATPEPSPSSSPGPGSLGAAALPPETQALIDEAAEEWEALGLLSYHGGADGGVWYADLTHRDVNQIRDLLMRISARLVAALPDAPAEPERKPNWVQCARCYHVWDDADDDHEVCPCLHEHGSRQVWPLTTVEVAALANTSTNLRAPAGDAGQ